MKRYVTALLSGGAGLALALSMAGAAGAAVTAQAPDAVSSTVLYTGPANAGGIATACASPLTSCTDSMAGWYTNSFADLFTQVDGTLTLNAEAEGVGISKIDGLDDYNGTTEINGAVGIQLCNESNGDAAQMGAVYLGGGQFAVGYLTGELEGLTVDPCAGGGVFQDASADTTFTALGAVPAGTQIEAQIKQDGHGVLFTAENLTEDVANYTAFDHYSWFYPNEAGAGLQADTAGLSAPAVNDLSDFSDVTATSGDVTRGLAYWNAVQVDGSQDGIAPALLAPSALTSNPGARACHRIWINGYWGKWYKHHGHEKRNWHRGHWKSVCSTKQDVSSSFSVDAGTPVS